MVRALEDRGGPDQAEQRLKVPPNSVEAEQSLLGGLMLDAQAWDKVADLLVPSDFYRKDHRLVFAAIAELAERSEPSDVVTVSELLDKRNELEAAGGLEYLATLANETPGAANVKAYAGILRERSMLRSLINAGNEISGSVFSGDGRSAAELVDQAEKLVFEIEGQIALIVARRELELTRGFEPLELFELGGLLATLLQRAASLLIEESSRATDGEQLEGDPPLDGGPPEIHSRVHPAIVSIATSIGRSATLAFKRLAGLSSYEWRILANIAYRPSVSFTELVRHIYSDKAQVSRALDSMVQRELVSRSDSRPGERVGLSLTAEGQRLHDIMETDSLRRNAILAADMKPAQRDRLQTYLDRLIGNATAMVTENR